MVKIVAVLVGVTAVSVTAWLKSRRDMAAVVAEGDGLPESTWLESRAGAQLFTSLGLLAGELAQAQSEDAMASGSLYGDEDAMRLDNERRRVELVADVRAAVAALTPEDHEALRARAIDLEARLERLDLATGWGLATLERARESVDDLHRRLSRSITP